MKVHVRVAAMVVLAFVAGGASVVAGVGEGPLRLRGFEKPRAERYEDYDVGGRVRGWRFDRRGFFLDGADQRALETLCRSHGRVEEGIVICPVFLYEGPPEDLHLLGRGEYRFSFDYGGSKVASARRYVRPLALRDGDRDKVSAHGGWQNFLRPSRSTLRGELWVSPLPCGDVAGWKGRAREFLAGRPWAGMREEHLQAMLGGALKAHELPGGGAEYAVDEMGVTFTVRGGVLVGATAKGRPAHLAPDPDAVALPGVGSSTPRARSVPALTPLTRPVAPLEALTRSAGPLKPLTTDAEPFDEAGFLMGEEREERDDRGDGMR